MAAFAAFAKYIPQIIEGFQMGKDVVDQINSETHVLKKLLDTIGGSWIEINDLSFKTARNMALSRQEAVKLNEQLIHVTKDIAAQYGITAKELAEFQRSYSEAIGRNVALAKEQYAHMAALSKITDSATAAQLVDDFDKIGVGIAGATANIGLLQEKAKAQGLNAAKVTKTLASNIKLASSYSFKNGVADIEKMALKATSLRMDMDAVMNAASKFQDVEGAIGTSAKLQMLGGAIGQKFSNPMATMYDSLADPKKFFDDITNSIKGLATYNAKTGEVGLGPQQAMMARAIADALGMNVTELTNGAFASVKNEAVMQQLGSNPNKFTPEQQAAIQNLARGNFNIETGKYEVKWRGADGAEFSKNVEDLTLQELKIAQDSQFTEENMQVDVRNIRQILESVHGRVRTTTSTKEKTEGIEEWWKGFKANFQNTYMGKVANAVAGFANNWIGTQYHFANGGIVKPLHAEMGTLIPGDSYMGDHTPVLANSGEMILNPAQQKSMFSLITTLATNGGLLYGANKLGNKVGVNGVGSTMLLASLLGGGNMDVGTLIEAHFIKKTIKQMRPLKQTISEVGETTEQSVSKMSNFRAEMGAMGSKWKGIFNRFVKDTSDSIKNRFTTGKLGKATHFVSKVGHGTVDLGKKLARGTRRLGNRWIVEPTVKRAHAASDWFNRRKAVKATKGYFDKIKNTQFDVTTKTYKNKLTGEVLDKKAVGNKFTRTLISERGYRKEFGEDIRKAIKDGFGDAKSAQQTTQEAAKNATKQAASLTTTPKPYTSTATGGYGNWNYTTTGNEPVTYSTNQPSTEVVKSGTKAVENGGREVATTNQAVAKQTTEVAKQTTDAAKTTTKATSKGAKALKTLGKLNKIGGKALPLVGTALSLFTAAQGISEASSNYDEQINNIERSDMTQLEKAQAKDKASKEKNKAIGGTIGESGGALAGAAIGASIGSVVPGIGTLIGGAVGGLIGGFGGNAIGKGIGGLFGGGEEKNFKEEQEKRFASYKDVKTASAINGSEDDGIKVLESIDRKLGALIDKVSIKSNSSISKAKPSLALGKSKVLDRLIAPVGGAAMGAAIGSIVPGVGTAVGGVLGGLVGAIKTLSDVSAQQQEISLPEGSEVAKNEPNKNLGKANMAIGTLAGAATGAGVGSMIMPGIGTIAGALIGGLVGNVGSKFLKTTPEKEKILGQDIVNNTTTTTTNTDNISNNTKSITDDNVNSTFTTNRTSIVDNIFNRTKNVSFIDEIEKRLGIKAIEKPEAKIQKPEIEKIGENKAIGSQSIKQSPIEKLKSSLDAPSALVKHLEEIDTKPISLANDATTTIRPAHEERRFNTVRPSSNDEGYANKSFSSYNSPTNINLNISGTIKLETDGRSTDIDLSKLIDTPEFKRQLLDIIQKQQNLSQNLGKMKNESEAGRSIFSKH